MLRYTDDVRCRDDMKTGSNSANYNTTIKIASFGERVNCERIVWI
jgi:hypothetical protein